MSAYRQVVSTPDDPFAPPAPGTAPVHPPTRFGDPPPVSRWSAPAGPPTTGPAGSLGPVQPARSPRVAIVSLVLGLLATLSGVTIIGGVLFGLPAILAGLAGRRLAAGQHQRSRTAVAGVALGVVGLLLAAGMYAYIRDDYRAYLGCRKESVSVRQDQQCTRDLERGLGLPAGSLGNPR